MEVINHADLLMLSNLVIKNYEENGEKRFVLGIVGVPGAGKSTLAAGLMNTINKIFPEERAIVVPMDGYHYHNDVLIEKGLLPLKGIPQTFDAKRFVMLIQEIVAEESGKIYCPSYDRSLHNPVEDSILIEERHKIIIVEGNYLLFDTEPWDELGTLFTESWFVETSPETTQQRLIVRHVLAGRSREEALDKISSTDAPNAELIMQTRQRASKVIRVAKIDGIETQS